MMNGIKMRGERMERYTAKINLSFFVDAGRDYWVKHSDFCNGCWHIYAAENEDTFLFNIFNDDDFYEVFGK